jgi:hypothetical protein
MPCDRVNKDDPSWDRQAEALAKILTHLTEAVRLAESMRNQIQARSLPYDDEVNQARTVARIAASELDTLGLMFYSMNGNRFNRRPRVVPPLPEGQGGPNWVALGLVCGAQKYGAPNWYETDKLTEVEYAVEVRVDDDTVLVEKAATIEQAAGAMQARLMIHTDQKRGLSGESWHAPAGLDRGVLPLFRCPGCGARQDAGGLLIHSERCSIKRRPGERAGNEETAT